MNYNFEDFSEKNYKKLLSKVKNKFILFTDVKRHKKFALWRHDVDFSVNRALALANIEKKENVSSTYFFQLGSMFYNVFEQSTKEKILQIILLGHSVGLHFDPTQYKIKSQKDLEEFLLFEKQILENLFNVKIDVFSFHNPTTEVLSFDEWEYSGMINTYAKFFKDNVKYCSDSNGYWRHKRLEEFLDENHSKIQVLTHPEWWQKVVMFPREKIQRCIDGRSRATALEYDEMLSRHKRKNIGISDD